MIIIFFRKAFGEAGMFTRTVMSPK